MERERYLQLQSTISQFPHIYQFLDDGFIRGQCESKLKNHLLKRLDNKEAGNSTRKHLPTLEKRLAKLALVTGYVKLKLLLRGASDWDEYQEFLAQLDITLWFQEKKLLKEIEPELPHKAGNADILLSFSQRDIYCEATSFQSIAKSIESKTKSEKNKIQDRVRELRKRQLWKTEQEIENELEIKRAARNLLYKTNHQLPRDYPGILALDTTKSAVFGLDVRDIAQRLSPSRPHVALIILWSWEGNGEDFNWDMSPTFFFVNSRSKFREIGEELLEHLDLKGEVLGV